MNTVSVVSFIVQPVQVFIVGREISLIKQFLKLNSIFFKAFWQILKLISFPAANTWIDHTIVDCYLLDKDSGRHTELEVVEETDRVLISQLMHESMIMTMLQPSAFIQPWWNQKPSWPGFLFFCCCRRARIRCTSFSICWTCIYASCYSSCWWTSAVV